MQEKFAQLIAVLEEQRSIQSALVSLSERKIAVIASGEVEALQQITEEEKELLVQIGAVEIRQTDSVESIAAAMGIPASEIKISLVIDHAAGLQKQRLIKIRNELTALVEKQIKYNDMNMKLLEMNMDYVQFILNKSVNQQVAPTYGNSGNVRKLPVTNTRLLDRKV